jgi:hypothetical protein
MRRRLYYVLPDLASAIQTANDLLLARIEDRHMHFVGRDGMSLGELHPASLAQTSDLRHSLQLGAALGLIGGLLLGVYLKMSPMFGFDFGVGTLIACTIGGGMFGSWTATLIGLSAPNPHLKPFKRDIAAGHIVLMVDVPAARVDEIHELVRRRHPEVADRGVDPAIPAFP